MFENMHHQEKFTVIIFGVIFAIFFPLIIATAETEAKNKEAMPKYTDVCIDGVIYLERSKSSSAAALSPKYNINGTIETCSNK